MSANIASPPALVRAYGLCGSMAELSSTVRSALARYMTAEELTFIVRVSSVAMRPALLRRRMKRNVDGRPWRFAICAGQLGRLGTIPESAILI
jgi:hypothetical protein